MADDIITFSVLKKNLKKISNSFKTIKIAILSDSASQFLTTAIKGIGIEYEVNYEIFESDYNQIYRQAYDITSDLYNFKPDYVIILHSTEKLINKFYTNESNKIDFASNQVNYIKGICDQIIIHHKCKIIINSFPEYNDSVFGNFSAKLNNSFLFQIKKLNYELMKFTQDNLNIFMIQIDTIFNYLGFKNCCDSKMYIGADMVYSIDVLPYLAKYLNDIILSINGNFKKCIILDLDNIHNTISHLENEIKEYKNQSIYFMKKI
jgi:predicted enzyme involved in methoxymalonyl-ACP biosynthesis